QVADAPELDALIALAQDAVLDLQPLGGEGVPDRAPAGEGREQIHRPEQEGGGNRTCQDGRQRALVPDRRHRDRSASAGSRAGRTARTEVMYGEPGHAYVYLIYGIHQMLNCVCGPGTDANAVLIRAAEPVRDSLPWLHRTAQGPGNLCKAFGVKPAQNGADL